MKLIQYSLLAIYLFCSSFLIAQNIPELKLQKGHTDKIYSLAFSPDQKLLVSGSKDGTAIVWDLASGRELKVLNPNREGVRRVTFSEDGKILFTASGNDIIMSSYDVHQDSLLKAWDIFAGKDIFTFSKAKSYAKRPDEHLRSVVGMAVNHQFNMMACIDWDGKLLVWDSNTGSYVGGGVLTGYRLSSVAMHPAEKMIAVGDEVGNIKLVNFDTGDIKELLKKDDDYGEIAHLTYSPNGKFLYALANKPGQGSVLKIWDTKEYKAVFTLENKGKYSFDEYFVITPDGKHLISDAGLRVYKIGEDGGLTLENAFATQLKEFPDKFKKLASTNQKADFFSSLALSKDGKFLAAAQNLEIWLYDVETGRQITSLKGSAFALSGLVSKAGDLFTYYGGQNNFITWDLVNNQLVQNLKTNGKKFSFYDISANDNQILSVQEAENYNQPPLYKIFDRTTQKLIDSFEPAQPYEFDDYAISDNGQQLAYPVDDGDVGIIGIRDVKNKKELARIQIHDESDGVTRYIRDLVFTDDNKYILVGEGNNTVKMWRLKDAKLEKTFQTGETAQYSSMLGLKLTKDDITCIKVSKDNKYMITGGMSENGNLILWDFKKGTVLHRFDAHKKYLKALVFSPKSDFFASGGQDHLIKIWDIKTGKLLKTLEGHEGEVRELAITADAKRLISLSLDNTLRYWDIETGKEVARLIIAGNGEDYVVVTSEGYYMATKEGAKTVHFVKDNQVYTFDQFDLQYNRPDKVLQTLGCKDKVLIDSYEKAYKKRLQKLNFDPKIFENQNEFNAPEIRLLGKSYFASTSQPSYELKIQAYDARYQLKTVNVWVNGVPVWGREGKEVAQKTDLQQQFSLELNKGTNVIEASVFNEKGIESLKEKVNVEYLPDNRFNKRPNLYIITIGVSEYANPEMNLKYAVKDGKDLVDLMKAKKDLYEEIKVFTYFDKNATKDNILKLKKTLEKTSVDDVVVVFVSGHGLLNQELDYYLATYDIDFRKPSEKGLAYSDLEGLLDGIPARQKILFMDACHSGEIDKEEVEVSLSQNVEEGDVKFRNFGTNIQNKQVGLQNSFELSKQLFTDLRRGSGTTVISAASGVELAMEGDKWKNGVFTYCLLSGLKEQKADLDKDGKVMLSELQKYLFEEVPNITNGKQQPTSRVENLSNDFRVW